MDKPKKMPVGVKTKKFPPQKMKSGGSVKGYNKGGKVSAKPQYM